MPVSRVLAVRPIQQVELHGDPRKVTGSWQRSPLHAAGACISENARIPPVLGRPYRRGGRAELIVGALTNVWSHYVNRRDQHVQEAEKCMGLVSSVLTMTSLVREVAQLAASSIAARLTA
jgi:hypothetical protein